MAIIQGNAKKSTAAGGFYPKVINGSLRFNDDDGAYLSWTPASAGDSRTWTLSFWMKPSNASTGQVIFGAGPNSSNLTRIDYRADKRFQIFNSASGVANGSLVFDPYKFRDPSAWYHFVFVVNTPASETDRYQFYANGERLTGISSTAGENTYPSLSATTQVNTAVAHEIGRRIVSNSEYFDGYLANVHFLNGIAATADDFGELKNGVWVAKDYTGLFDSAAETALGHANGFYLTFEDDTEVEAFNTVLYRGNGGTQSITGVGFSPDLVWAKKRGPTAASHRLLDTVRGVQKNLYSDLTTAEQTQNSVMSFDSDGFTVGDSAGTNGSGDTFVAWCWKAGGSSNTYNVDGTGYATASAAGITDGTLPLTGLSVSTTYGFSICTFNSGASGTQTFAHGLGTTPSLCIFKEKDSGGAGDHWVVWEGMTGNPATSYGYLNLPNTFGTDTSQWSNTAPTSTLFTFNSGYAWSTSQNMIAYCWAEKTNYSKFGSYEGNGSTNGPEIDCGFVPALVLIKDIGRAEHWVIFDGTRETQNDRNLRLFPSSNSIESPIPTGDGVRFLSTSNGDSINGFKITTNSYGINDNVDSDVTKIYAAFADTREAAFWLDQSGNDNDWQPVNLDHNDTLLDSPTNNFATWNPLDKASGIVLSDGNLRITSTSDYHGARSTIALPSSGQWYFEVKVGATSGNPADQAIGLMGDDAQLTTVYAGSPTLFYIGGGAIYTNGSGSTANNQTWTNGDVIGVAVDMDAGTVTFTHNGSALSGSGAGAQSLPSNSKNWFIGGYWATSRFAELNCGQQPFKYDPPA